MSEFRTVFKLRTSKIAACNKRFSEIKLSKASGTDLRCSLRHDQQLWNYVVVVKSYIWSNIRVISSKVCRRDHICRRSARLLPKDSLASVKEARASFIYSWVLLSCTSIDAWWGSAAANARWFSMRRIRHSQRRAKLSAYYQRIP